MGEWHTFAVRTGSAWTVCSLVWEAQWLPTFTVLLLSCSTPRPIGTFILFLLILFVIVFLVPSHSYRLIDLYLSLTLTAALLCSPPLQRSSQIRKMALFKSSYSVPSLCEQRTKWKLVLLVAITVVLKTVNTTFLLDRLKGKQDIVWENYVGHRHLCSSQWGL